jgi:hypothetical protein
MASRDRDALIGNAADPDQQEAAKPRAKAAADQWREDWRFCLEAPQARRVLWSLLVRCSAVPVGGAFQSANASRGRIMRYHGAQRDIGDWVILNMQDADMSAYARLLVDNREKPDA